MDRDVALDINPRKREIYVLGWKDMHRGSDHNPLGCENFVVVQTYDMSCALILLTGLYGWDSMVDIDINPSSMGPIFGVRIGPTRGVPKWTICHWATAIW